MNVVQLTENDAQIALCKRWEKIRASAEKQLNDIPNWAQNVFFDDIDTAIQKRLEVLSKINKA